MNDSPLTITHKSNNGTGTTPKKKGKFNEGNMNIAALDAGSNRAARALMAERGGDRVTHLGKNHHHYSGAFIAAAKKW